MPIKYMTVIADGTHIIQTCNNCRAEHTISFDRGAQKTKRGPFAIPAGGTLVLRIDGNAPVTATFDAGAFSGAGEATAEQLAAFLAHHVPGVRARDDAGGVLIESATTGDQSRVEILEGTARASLGFSPYGAVDPCTGRPVLGFQGGAETRHPDVIMLRRCNDCGANECLVRSFDRAGPEHEGTHFQAHRKAVNALAQHAKACGWSHPALAAHHRTETHPPPDIDHRFPANSLEPARFLEGHKGGSTEAQTVESE